MKDITPGSVVDYHARPGDEPRPAVLTRLSRADGSFADLAVRPEGGEPGRWDYLVDVERCDDVASGPGIGFWSARL